MTAPRVIVRLADAELGHESVTRWAVTEGAYPYGTTIDVPTDLADRIESEWRSGRTLSIEFQIGAHLTTFRGLIPAYVQAGSHEGKRAVALMDFRTLWQSWHISARAGESRAGGLFATSLVTIHRSADTVLRALVEPWADAHANLLGGRVQIDTAGVSNIKQTAPFVYDGSLSAALESFCEAHGIGIHVGPGLRVRFFSLLDLDAVDEMLKDRTIRRSTSPPTKAQRTDAPTEVWVLLTMVHEMMCEFLPRADQAHDSTERERKLACVLPWPDAAPTTARGRTIRRGEIIYASDAFAEWESDTTPRGGPKMTYAAVLRRIAHRGLEEVWPGPQRIGPVAGLIASRWAPRVQALREHLFKTWALPDYWSRRIHRIIPTRPFPYGGTTGEAPSPVWADHVLIHSMPPVEPTRDLITVYRFVPGTPADGSVRTEVSAPWTVAPFEFGAIHGFTLRETSIVSVSGLHRILGAPRDREIPSATPARRVVPFEAYRASVKTKDGKVKPLALDPTFDASCALTMQRADCLYAIRFRTPWTNVENRVVHLRLDPAQLFMPIPAPELDDLGLSRRIFEVGGAWDAERPTDEWPADTGAQEGARIAARYVNAGEAVDPSAVDLTKVTRSREAAEHILREAKIAADRVADVWRPHYAGVVDVTVGNDPVLQLHGNVSSVAFVVSSGSAHQEIAFETPTRPADIMAALPEAIRRVVTEGQP